MLKKSILILSLALAISSSALAQGVSVPQPSPGTVQVSPVPSVVCPSGQVNKWNGTDWSTCVAVGGGGPVTGFVGAPGMVNVYWDTSSGAWVAADSTGAVFCTSSPTSCMQEAINSAIAGGLRYTIWGSRPITITNATLQLPAQSGTPFVCIPSCKIRINNGAQDGINIDTMQHTAFLNAGGQIEYSGSGRGVVIQPRTVVAGTIWLIDTDFQFGTISGTGGTPQALLAVDVTQVCVPGNWYHTSSFGPNKITVNIEANNVAMFGYRVYSPTCAQQAAAQNTVHIVAEGAVNSEMYIGTYNGAPHDANIGSNNYFGQPTHTATAAGTYMMISDATNDRFYLTSANNNTNGLPFTVYWGTNASNNKIMTGQSWGWSTAPGVNAGSPAIPNVICGYSASTAC